MNVLCRTCCENMDRMDHLVSVNPKGTRVPSAMTPSHVCQDTVYCGIGWVVISSHLGVLDLNDATLKPFMAV